MNGIRKGRGGLEDAKEETSFIIALRLRDLWMGQKIDGGEEIIDIVTETVCRGGSGLSGNKGLRIVEDRLCALYNLHDLRLDFGSGLKDKVLDKRRVSARQSKRFLRPALAVEHLRELLARARDDTGEWDKVLCPRCAERDDPLREGEDALEKGHRTLLEPRALDKLLVRHRAIVAGLGDARHLSHFRYRRCPIRCPPSH